MGDGFHHELDAYLIRISKVNLVPWSDLRGARCAVTVPRAKRYAPVPPTMDIVWPDLASSKSGSSDFSGVRW
jgi:hypothetical protein